MGWTLDVITANFATAARLGVGLWVSNRLGQGPDQPLELYEFEACPYCRKVREVLSILDLAVMVYPCPKGGQRFRTKVKAMGGKLQFPYLIDSSRNVQMYESSQIVRYLYQQYGQGSEPLFMPLLINNPLSIPSLGLASLLRLGQGQQVRPSKAPNEPLILWNFEGSPYCRLVRETLCTLEIPYLARNVAKGSSHRPLLIQKAGKMQVPYLEDPNTGTALFESLQICRYLEQTYGL